jgi:hypothetical protein
MARILIATSIAQVKGDLRVKNEADLLMRAPRFSIVSFPFRFSFTSPGLITWTRTFFAVIVVRWPDATARGVSSGCRVQRRLRPPELG